MMTKDFQKELKRSKSTDDILSSPTPSLPLQKSKSQLEIPLVNQPSPKEQITQLKQTLTFTQTTAQNYLKNLQLAQAKITELEENKEKDNKLKEKINQLEDQILQLRLDKIKEFGDYLEKKEELSKELEENITQGVNEIERLEKKLLATNKRKLELQQKLSQEQGKNARLELQLINNEEPRRFNY